MGNNLKYVLGWSILRGNDYAGHVSAVLSYGLEWFFYAGCILFLAINHHYGYTDSFMWFTSMFFWSSMVIRIMSVSVNTILINSINLDSSEPKWVINKFLNYVTIAALWIGTVIIMKVFEHSAWYIVFTVPIIAVFIVFIISGFLTVLGDQFILFQFNSEQKEPKSSSIVLIGGGLLVVFFAIVLIAAIMMFLAKHNIITV